jgi:FixJ family two-component response regulator
MVHVVDDEPGVRNALKRLLEARGFAVCTYPDAEEFLAVAGAEGCVILDYDMPGMTGLELQRELNTRGARWQVIFLSGRSDFLIRARHVAMAAGAVAVLAKPARAHDLFAAIERAIEHLRPAAPGPEQPAAD